MNTPMHEQAWHRMTEEIMSGMREWRTQHPQATLREMENELDARWARVRARMLEDMALASAAADWTDSPAGEHPCCPACGTALQLRSRDTRQIQTHGGHTLTLTRRYGVCPTCGVGLFPPR